MKVLGITGRTHDAAAALAVDGRIVSAVTEDSFARMPGIGYAQTGGFPHAAVNACLAAAGIGLDDLTEVVAVDDGAAVLAGPAAPAGLAVRSIDAVQADAIQAAMAAP